MFQFLIELPLKESLLRCMEKWSLSSNKRAYPKPVCKDRTLFCAVIVKFSKGSLMVKRCEVNVVLRTYWQIF